MGPDQQMSPIQESINRLKNRKFYKGISNKGNYFQLDESYKGLLRRNHMDYPSLAETNP